MASNADMDPRLKGTPRQHQLETTAPIRNHDWKLLYTLETRVSGNGGGGGYYVRPPTVTNRFPESDGAQG